MPLNNAAGTTYTFVQDQRNAPRSPPVSLRCSPQPVQTGDKVIHPVRRPRELLGNMATSTRPIDYDLFHHYFTVTVSSITPVEERRQLIWTDLVRNCAQSCGHIKYALLALSALHRASQSTPTYWTSDLVQLMHSSLHTSETDTASSGMSAVLQSLVDLNERHTTDPGERQTYAYNIWVLQANSRLVATGARQTTTGTSDLGALLRLCHELRPARRDLNFDEDVTIHKGQRVCVDSYNMMNPDIYDQPKKYDAYRFLRMRDKPGFENKGHLVATTPDHLSFGHGQHACPGHFFAANEMKVALCHLLLKYDWKLASGCSVDPTVVGVSRSVNPTTRLLFRRREEDIPLASLGFDDDVLQ
ncbi:hypothetical protein ABOM_011363 [Aspergillus bombycis]|uniref:Cytochrome P450 n=1 Tax=Aspergillus bombycis TaxID=109264 RepID=A0A1F7ZKE9_9EURO|nr:hypothetical protein ABOM_011363 [Aspergillus bombycis]OGM39927.1 hypothetical protein ABOM_011363 [Aspergillus bombycis]